MTNTSSNPTTVVNGGAAGHAKGNDFPVTDPAVYKEYSTKWSKKDLPKDEEGWVSRAKEVASILAKDIVKRNAENKAPFAEVALLKHSGLLKVLGPKKYGGGEQPWGVGYKTIRETNGSLGMLLGYHLLWSTTANVVGTPEQADRIQHLILSNNYFLGGAVNPRDDDHKITTDSDHIVFNGFKRFNTGGVVSDLTVLEGVYEGTEDHIFAIVKTQQPGIEFQHDWHNIGLRLTESGSVAINNIRVPWADALGWSPETKKAIPEVLKIPYATLLLPTIQLVFGNLYLGIATGALKTAAAYTTKSTRPWPYAGNDAKKSASDEFYILERYGNFHAHIAAATALADKAGALASATYAAHAGDHASLTAARRGEFAEEVAAVKIVTTDTGLRVTAGVFEVTGSKATSESEALDRFWRDLRTHTLHDPVAYKNRELGRWNLLGEAPEPTWYT